MSIFSQGHALIIGVGADLPNTVKDATGLADLLKDPERCAYPAEQVTVLTQKEATRGEILDALDQLASSANSESTVVIYFSGHGYELTTSFGKQYFLMPYGYTVSDLTATAIGGPEFMAKLEAIKAQKMLILLDCCHADGMDNEDMLAKAPGVSFAKAPLPPDAPRLLGEGRGRVMIASSQADQKSYTGDPYSQFTQALLEALTGVGTPKKDGFARAGDLAMYTGRTVPKYTAEKQIPVLNFDKADNFAVAYYAGGATEPKGLPASAQRQVAADTTVEANAGTSRPSTSINQPGSGAIAVGENANAASEGGVAAGTIHGDVLTGANARKINAGTYNESQHIDNSSVFNQSGQTVHGKQTNFAGNVNTGGGLFNAGDINTGGGDFVGRDKNVRGDEVRGDKIGGDKLRIGNVSGSNVAAGRGAQVNVNTNPSAAEIVRALQPILLAAQAAPIEKREEAVQKAEELKEEVEKGERADDGKIGGLLDDLAKLLPNAVSAIGAAFGQPLLAGIAGPVTTFILRRLGIK